MNRDLKNAPGIGAGARAMLRAQARAVDAAERHGTPRDVSKTNETYLALRQAHGLVGEVQTLDPFEAFVAGLSTPSLGDSQDAEPA